MTRAGAIILEAGRVALIERRRGSELYFLFPGGGVEDGETAVEAMVREVREELGLDVEPGRLVADVQYRGNSQLFFLADVRSGRFGSGLGAEMTNAPPAPSGSYRAVWLEIEELVRQPVHPRALAELIVAARNLGWPGGVLVFEDEGRAGRRRG